MNRRVSISSILKGMILLFFLIFLFVPIGQIVWRALTVEGTFSVTNLMQTLVNEKWGRAFQNSVLYSAAGALLATGLSFILAYGMNFTNIPKKYLNKLTTILLLPMLLPTITYGFVLLYSFGKQGLWTRIFGHEFFSIYGATGVIMGFVLYTLPVTFILLNHSMHYLDKRFLLVSRLMQDGWLQRLWVTILQPMRKILIIAFLQAFFMAFTDFGIPTALGGQTTFITTLLYEGFMGAIPNFQQGSVIALTMLIPSIISIILLNYLQKKEHFDSPKEVRMKTNQWRDWLFGVLLTGTTALIFCLFLVMFVIPFVSEWPYELQFTLAHIKRFLTEQTLVMTLRNSLFVASMTAIFGTIIAYVSGLLVARAPRQTRMTRFLDSFATITNSVPGMVLGVAYLLIFSGGILHNTSTILVILTVIHYFGTPYQMAKDALLKLNPNWENTAKIMGDRWIDTVIRVLIPNSLHTIVELFTYYFTNAMVTISGVIFLTSARTILITVKIKELQHFGKFTDIFILSLLLLFINSIVLLISSKIKRRIGLNEKAKKHHRWRIYFGKYVIFERLRGK